MNHSREPRRTGTAYSGYSTEKSADGPVDGHVGVTFACRASEIARGLSVQLLPAKLSNKTASVSVGALLSSRIRRGAGAGCISRAPRFEGRCNSHGTGSGCGLKHPDRGVRKSVFQGKNARPSIIGHDRHRRLVEAVSPTCITQRVGAGDWRSGLPAPCGLFQGECKYPGVRAAVLH